MTLIRVAMLVRPPHSRWAGLEVGALDSGIIVMTDLIRRVIRKARTLLVRQTCGSTIGLRKTFVRGGNETSIACSDLSLLVTD
jgi:hypothetical protein